MNSHTCLLTILRIIHWFTLMKEIRVLTIENKHIVQNLLMRDKNIVSICFVFQAFRYFSQYPVSLPLRASFPSSRFTLSHTSAGTADEYGVPGRGVR
jgi:hypothetical protein